MDFNNNNQFNFDSGAEQAQKMLAGGQGALEKFRELPKNVQMGILGGVFIFIVMIFSGGDEVAPPEVVVVSVEAEEKISNISISDKDNGDGTEDSFGVVNTSRESLISGFIGQQELALSKMQKKMTTYVEGKETQISALQEDIIKRNNDFQQMMEGFRQQISSMEESNRSYREEIARIADEARRQSAQTARGSGANTVQGTPPSRIRISQTPLGGEGVAANSDQALLNFDVPGGNGVRSSVQVRNGVVMVKKPQPFIPPLGFIRGTLLNGVDALTGGKATPALVRLTGTYKTAMNSVVSLNGCFVLVEFEGDISTERAMGKPSRMTCIYPDQGAVTYSLTGYVVDAKDGVTGVPGIFYEGDASRIAAAMTADFAAGLAAVIKEAQFEIRDNSSSDTQTKLLTGNDMKAGVVGGVEKATSQLSDYLMERATRVVPFVRIDATRDINLVLLSGVTLRDNGEPWTLLFDGQAADAALEAGNQAIEDMNNSKK